MGTTLTTVPSEACETEETETGKKIYNLVLQSCHGCVLICEKCSPSI